MSRSWIFYGIVIDVDLLLRPFWYTILSLCFLVIYLNRKPIVAKLNYIVKHHILSPLSDRLILKPCPFDQEKYEKSLAHPFIINEKIYTKDGEILDVLFYNANKFPTYGDDVIYIYTVMEIRVGQVWSLKLQQLLI